MATRTKIRTWCVYTSGLTDSIGREYCPGDGITTPTRRLYALAGSETEAKAIMAQFERGKLLTRTRMPGDGRLYPDLDVAEYDPLDFVGSQNRDEYTGERYAALCGRLAQEATRNAAELT